MKKIAGLLLLTAAVILTAGCVTTADPIVGSWQTTEPIQYEDYGYSLSYMLTFEKDGTGEIIYSYSYAEIDYYYPIIWEKTSEDAYLCEELSLFIFSEDGKTMTDDYQYTYSLAEGEEKIGGVWTEVLPEGEEPMFYYTYVFNEDGTGVETLHQDGEKSYAYNLQWEEYAENQIFIRYVDSYTIEDGKMKTTLDDEVIFEEVDGIWVETPLEGLQLITYEFRDDGICVCTIYDRETKEFLDVYFYEYTPTEAGGILKSKYMSEYVLLEDGTLQDVNYGDILERVSSA
ncbi:MAG: hypothetical protein IIX51_01375 [Methanocorpusculum sp.]|jgi:hypothetical protein|nr:hypothetical protein [Methanocorpusculum sp.]